MIGRGKWCRSTKQPFLRGPHYCAVPRRPTMPVPRAQVANRFPDISVVSASLPGHPLWPHAFLACRQRLCGALPRARRSKSAVCRATARAARTSLQFWGLRRRGRPHSCAAPRRPKVHAPHAQFATRDPDSLPATLRCPSARRGPTPFSPVASAAQRRDAQTCPHRVPNLRTVAPSLRPQCLVARPPVVAPPLSCPSPAPRNVGMSQHARAACPICERLSQVSAGNASLQGRPLWPHVPLARRPHRRGGGGAARDVATSHRAMPHGALIAHLAPV